MSSYSVTVIIDVRSLNTDKAEEKIYTLLTKLEKDGKIKSFEVGEVEELEED